MRREEKVAIWDGGVKNTYLLYKNASQKLYFFFFFGKDTAWVCVCMCVHIHKFFFYIIYIHTHMCVCMCVCVCVCVCVCLVTQSCLTLCHPMVYSLPSPSVHWVLQAEYWSGLPFPSPDLPNPGIELGSPALREVSLPSELPRKTYRS